MAIVKPRKHSHWDCRKSWTLDSTKFNFDILITNKTITDEDATPSSAGSFTLLLESSLSQDVTQYSQNPAIGE